MAIKVDQMEVNKIIEEAGISAQDSSQMIQSITNEDPEIEILMESRSSRKQFRESSTYKNGHNRSISIETIESSDTEFSRRSSRISEMKLQTKIYGQKSEKEWLAQLSKKKDPKKSLYRHKKRIPIAEEKRLLEKERIQIDKERKLLEREKKLLEREKKHALENDRTGGRLIMRKLDQEPSTSTNNYKYLPISTESFSNVTTNGYPNDYNPSSTMSHLPNEDSETSSTTVRDYLKSHLNIQRGQSYQLPPLRKFKQRKATSIPHNSLADYELPPSVISPLDRLFAKKRPRYVQGYPIPAASMSTSAETYNSDSYRDMLNSPEGTVGHPTRYATKRTLQQSTHIQEDIIDDVSDEFEEESVSCELLKSDDEEIEVIYDSALIPSPQTFSGQGTKRDSRTLVADITNVKPLDLDSILGNSNSSYSKEDSPDIIEIDDSSPQRNTEYTPLITDIKPLDMSTLFGGPSNRVQEESNVELEESSSHGQKKETVVSNSN